MDAAALPAVACLARRAQRGFDESKAPLLGVMGAFVFAAQMINFPVGPGTTGHLVGGTLLAITLGPCPASMVMTAILAIQALIFQDGGILAMGANIVNMALLGVLAGYLPYAAGAATRWRKAAIFGGGLLSVFVSAILALAELLISGVRMPGPVLGISLLLFLTSAILEGAITLAVVESLEAMQPKFVRAMPARRSPALGIVGISAILLASVGVLWASSAPDGIQKLARDSGVATHAFVLLHTPFTGYRTSFLQPGFLATSGAGLAGIALIYGACLLFGRVARRRSL